MGFLVCGVVRGVTGGDWSVEENRTLGSLMMMDVDVDVMWTWMWTWTWTGVRSEVILVPVIMQ